MGTEGRAEVSAVMFIASLMTLKRCSRCRSTSRFSRSSNPSVQTIFDTSSPAALCAVMVSCRGFFGEDRIEAATVNLLVTGDPGVEEEVEIVAGCHEFPFSR